MIPDLSAAVRAGRQFFLCAGFLGLSAASVFAQGEVDRAQLFRQSAPVPMAPSENGVEEFGQAPASPNDSDMGEQRILKRQQDYEPFTFSSGIPIYYTSNVGLTRSGEIGDVVYVPQVALTYQPQLTRTLFAEATIQQQQFYYGEFDALDFGAFDVGGGLLYVVPRASNLMLRARYNFNRLTDDDFCEFYANHSLFFSAEVPLRYGRAHQVTLGANANVSLYAMPDGPQRTDYETYAAYSLNISRQFNLTASGRLSFRDYYETDRTDVSEILAFVATYRFNDWAAISAISSFAWNQSNQSVFDYHVANAGGAAAFTFRF